jgi:succinoglycan biosynthesis transport protein ExoP
MSLVQFWRILWARRWLVLAATVGCVLGAYLVIIIATPRWEAHARILLNLLQPDPLTGQVVAGSEPSTYVASQVQLIGDYSVAGLVVDRMGLARDPLLIAKYQMRSSNDHRDFRHWAAQQIMDRTKADVVEGSNILEITCTDKTAASALAVAEALRTAFFDTSLWLRRSEANRNADWFMQEAAKEKLLLDRAEARESDFASANHVYMATDTLDVDSARLAALATQQGATAQQVAGGSSPASLQVADLDAEIAQAEQTLGPNHPQLRALRAKRAALAAAAAQERSAMSPLPRKGSAANTLDAAAAAIAANHDKLSQLKQLHADVLVRRDLYNKTLARAADFRQQAAITDVGLTALGPAIVPPAPEFPKKSLILAGALAFGLGLGVLIALLSEFLNRRVRGHEDLRLAVDAPLLAVVVAPFRPQ